MGSGAATGSVVEVGVNDGAGPVWTETALLAAAAPKAVAAALPTPGKPNRIATASNNAPMAMKTKMNFLDDPSPNSSPMV